MIITKLVGGLGNQMFQYAIARAYQRRKSEKIFFDTRLLIEVETDIEKITLRPYALGIFKNLKAQQGHKNLDEVFSGSGYFARIKRRIFRFRTRDIKQKLMILPKGYAYSTEPIPFSRIYKRNIYLEGNFQSELYFKHIRKDILEDFAFPVLDKANDITRKVILKTPNALSIHIRRGDYTSSLNAGTFTSVNLDYYHRAVSKFQEKTGIERMDVFLFTDDMDWARSNFIHDKLNITYIDGNVGENSWKDMCLMSCCQHHIIANSTFSWWGAWLSQRGGVTLAPRHWFRPGTIPYNINDIIPKSWTIVDYALDDVKIC